MHSFPVKVPSPGWQSHMSILSHVRVLKISLLTTPQGQHFSLFFFFCKWGGKYKHPEEEYNFFPTLAYCQLLKHEMWSLPILACMTTNVVAHKNYPVPFQNPVTVFNVRIFYSTSGCTEVNAPITRSYCTSFAVHEHKKKKRKKYASFNLYSSNQYLNKTKSGKKNKCEHNCAALRYNIWFQHSNSLALKQCNVLRTNLKIKSLISTKKKNHQENPQTRWLSQWNV